MNIFLQVFLKVNILSALSACYVTVFGEMVDKYKYSNYFDNATHYHNFDTSFFSLNP